MARLIGALIGPQQVRETLSTHWSAALGREIGEQGPCLARCFAETLAGADSAADAERRRGLRRMKLVALSFLIGATVIFLFCTWAQSRGAGEWVGYVRAAAEAGMVGALADWFAVTALFKHPLGVPIPHTAIINRSVYGFRRSVP